MEGRLDKKTLRIFLVVMLVFGAILNTNATHLRAGQITATRVDCASLTYRITVTVFTDTESGIHFGGEEDFLDFGDGTVIKVPETDHTKIDGNVPNLGTASFTIEHTYGAPGTYIVSYIEPNRNDHILNIDNSVNTRFYIESKLIIDPFLESQLGCNSSPELLIPPIDQGCVGKAFYHNPGAYDPDGDSLSYEFVIPYKNRGTVVDNFRFPDSAEFYTSLNYNLANEDGTGPPDITIDPVSGTIIWDAPGKAGEYNIAFIVREWRQKNGVWNQLGYVRRDMQIIISDCDNDRPELIVPDDTCIVAGTKLEALILGTDPNNDRVKIEAYSEILNFDQDSAYYTPFPPDFQLTDPEAELNFTWATTCEHVKDQPYQVVFKITDSPPTGPPLVTFESWKITVVAPAPVWQDATVDLGKRHATLEWEPYECATVSNVKLQIWRRVDDITFEPGHCETGMPEYLGYELIATIGADKTSYVDTNGGQGLAVGAQYCYRMVAIFPLPQGGQSYVSEEICVDPIIVDAPVITNVSVERTGTSDGEVLLKWLPPFEIDLAQFPKPHKYEVQRSESLSGPFVSAVHPGLLDETVTEITDTGLNTEDRTYYYRIFLYATLPIEGLTLVDTSSIASTVRLELRPQRGQIDLSWRAFVPWSNQIQTFPNHDVYRGDEGAKVNADLTFYDQVNIFVNGQVYSDDGTAAGIPLDDNTLYCYQVVTRGGYGNPAIPEPLINYSQIICAQPKDSIPPCSPILTVDIIDCKEFLKESCDFTNFENTLRWAKPEDDCASDISAYRIYASTSKNGQYQLIKDNVRDTFFIDKSLPSYARCYRISSVDRSGNESELSAPVCSENCPYYELPNVFTVNGDTYNDEFRAYGPGDVKEDCDDPPCLPCARFVQKVNFNVFNRWGKEVYSFESGGENSIFINWDGRDKQGRELPSAVYYYSAEVLFYAADPSKRVKLFKGWIHLVR